MWSVESIVYACESMAPTTFYECLVEYGPLPDNPMWKAFLAWATDNIPWGQTTDLLVSVRFCGFYAGWKAHQRAV